MIISFLLTQFTFVNYVSLITINGNGCNHTMSKQSKNKFNRNSSLDTIHNSSRNNNGNGGKKKGNLERAIDSFNYHYRFFKALSFTFYSNKSLLCPALK